MRKHRCGESFGPLLLAGEPVSVTVLVEPGRAGDRHGRVGAETAHGVAAVGAQKTIAGSGRARFT